MIRLLNAHGQTKVKQKLTRDEVKFYLGIIIFVMLAIISLGMVNSPMEEILLVIAGLVWVIVTIWTMWSD